MGRGNLFVTACEGSYGSEYTCCRSHPFIEEGRGVGESVCGTQFTASEGTRERFH